MSSAASGNRAALHLESGPVVELPVRRSIASGGSARLRRSEDAPSAGQHVVQRVLEVRRRIGELLPDLLDVFLVALLDLLAKELLERAGAEPFLALLRMVGDDVGDEGTRQPP